MADDSLDEYIDAASRLLRLPVKDAWKPAVRANLEVSLRLARLVDEFEFSDEAEPASVFTA
jgi:1-carboxybiuret hydrolase subunit AtzG-like